MKTLTLITDKERLDVGLITDFISQSYWAKGRTKEQVQKAIANSLNFGLFLHEQQIGYARVITDYTTLAYLMDVFIVEEQRGKGYAKHLLENMLAYPELKGVERWKLSTKDAHGLYEQVGFEQLAKNGNMMERILSGS